MYIPTTSLLLSTLLTLFATAEIHTVDVGEDGFAFSPQTLNVKVSDTVIFHLYPSHNVVSGPFDSPCTPTSGSGGFFSGPFSGTDNGKKKFVVNVTSEDTVWFYCAVQKHCQSGMVGGWNVPTSGNTIEAFADAAKSVSQASAPSALAGGELLEDEQLASLTASGGSATPTPSGSASGSASGASTTPAASGTPSGSDAAASPSSTGAADVVVAGQLNGAMAVVVGFAAWFL